MSEDRDLVPDPLDLFHVSKDLLPHQRHPV